MVYRESQRVSADLKTLLAGYRMKVDRSQIYLPVDDDLQPPPIFVNAIDTTTKPRPKSIRR
jgi:hypothetical protein